MPQVPERKLSLGEILESKKRTKIYTKAKKSKSHWEKVGNLWYRVVEDK